jgi:hypothetical protein
MRSFGNKFKRSATDDSALVAIAEDGVDILAKDLAHRNWTKIWDSLCNSELSSPPITAKMSPEAQEKFKSVVGEIKKAFVEEKENEAKYLGSSLQKALEKMLEKL